MELIDLPLATTSGNIRFFSDDVDKPTRFYGFFADIELAEADASQLRLRFTNNTFTRSAAPTGENLYFATRWGHNPRAVSQTQNPFLVTLNDGILIPNGITAVISDGQSDHIRYIKVFVER